MSRTLAIGDIHGCLNVLLTLLEFVGVRDEDTLVTVGDYVDRGPDSRGVIDWLIENHKSGRLKPLRGNHDVMMLNARHDIEKLTRFLKAGGDATLDSYKSNGTSNGRIGDVPTDHWDFLENNLLPYYETDRHFFVHGNVYPELPLSDQPDFMLYWEKFNDPPAHQSGKIMVCGHTAQKTGVPKYNDNAVCIDTRAYGNGWLTCFDVEARFIWQANRSGETRKFFLDDSELWKTDRPRESPVP